MPPKRAERAASRPDALTEASDPSETIEERHARLTKAVQAQRQLAEIEELGRENSGKSPRLREAGRVQAHRQRLGWVLGQLKG